MNTDCYLKPNWREHFQIWSQKEQKPMIITEELKENCCSDCGRLVFMKRESVCVCVHLFVWEWAGLMDNIYIGCWLVYVSNRILVVSTELWWKMVSLMFESNYTDIWIVMQSRCQTSHVTTPLLLRDSVTCSGPLLTGGGAMLWLLLQPGPSAHESYRTWVDNMFDTVPTSVNKRWHTLLPQDWMFFLLHALFITWALLRLWIMDSVNVGAVSRSSDMHAPLHFQNWKRGEWMEEGWS